MEQNSFWGAEIRSVTQEIRRISGAQVHCRFRNSSRMNSAMSQFDLVHSFISKQNEVSFVRHSLKTAGSCDRHLILVSCFNSSTILSCSMKSDKNIVPWRPP
jgi:hypothetical protein